MNLRYILLLLIFCVATGAPVQTKRLTGSRSRVLLRENKPSVYLSFERIGKREPLYSSESEQGVWLRIHNNTRWSIFFPAFEVPRKLGDLGMFYEVVADGATLETVRVGYRVGHVSSDYTLPPGRSVVFSFPREHLAKGLALQVYFNYGWENKGRTFAGLEPKHSVSFYATELPSGTPQ